MLQGRGLLQGARPDEYLIRVGLDGLCVIIEINNYNITCLPPETKPRTNTGDLVFILVSVVLSLVVINLLVFVLRNFGLNKLLHTVLFVQTFDFFTHRPQMWSQNDFLTAININKLLLTDLRRLQKVTVMLTYILFNAVKLYANYTLLAYIAVYEIVNFSWIKSLTSCPLRDMVMGTLFVA